MAWRFDPIGLKVIWVVSVEEVLQTSGSIDFSTGGDLLIDTGLRENGGEIDQGNRVEG